MNYLFLMDPLEHIKVEKDTTFAMMLAAFERKKRVFYLPEGGITYNQGHFLFQVTEVNPQRNLSQPFIKIKTETLTEKDVDAIFVRIDPPFDYHYLMQTWLLDRLPPTITVINKPSGIRAANEKLFCLQFPNFIPPTLVSSDRAALLNFIAEQKDVIAKPTDGFGGREIFRVQEKGQNRNVILETLTDNFTQTIILQKYIPQADEGDKRILLLNGEFLGTVLRVHAAEEHRNNFFSGGQPRQTAITEQDRRIIRALCPELQKLGLYFVGIDVIGDCLIEVNVTSPTGVQEINRLEKTRLELKILDFVEGLIRQNKSEKKR